MYGFDSLHYCNEQNDNVFLRIAYKRFETPINS